MMSVPALGNWLIPKNWDSVSPDGPGMVVDILPSGTSCVLASRSPPDYVAREFVHDTTNLKGPMTGKVVRR